MNQFNDMWETCAGAFSLVDDCLFKKCMTWKMGADFSEILFLWVSWAETPIYVKINK